MPENCVLIVLDWVEPMMQLCLARQIFMHFSCIPTLSFLYFQYSVVMVFFCLFPSLSLSLSLSLFRIVCAWHQSINPLCLGTLFILGHLLLILLLFTSSSVIRRPIRTSRRTSPTIVFIQNATWSFSYFFYTKIYLIYLFLFLFTKQI